MFFPSGNSEYMGEENDGEHLVGDVHDKDQIRPAKRTKFDHHETSEDEDSYSVCHHDGGPRGERSTDVR